MADEFLADLFNKQPKSLAERFGDAQKALNAGRNQKILAALNQVKLNYAQPQEQAKLSYLQDKAKYEPMLDQANLGRIGAVTNHENAMTTLAQTQNVKAHLAVAGQYYDNLYKQARANNAPDYFKNQVKLQQGKIALADQKTDAAANTALSTLTRGLSSKEKDNFIASHKAYIAATSHALNNVIARQKAIMGNNAPQGANSPPGNASPQNSPAPSPGVTAPPPAPVPFNPMGNMSGQSSPDNSAPDDSGAPDNSAPAPQDTSMPAQQDNTSSAPPPMIAAPQSQAAPQSAPAPTPPAQPAAQPQSQLSPEDQTFQTGAQILANKNAVSSQDTNKLGASIEIEKVLQDPMSDVYAAAMAKYSGILGRGKAALERWKTSNPEDYERNLAGRNQFKSMIVNLNKKLENLGVQITQREELIGNVMQGFDDPLTNPQRAMDQWHKTKQIFRTLSLANSVAAQPLYPGVREKQAGLSFDNHIDVNQRIRILVDGKPKTVPLKNLSKALEEPGIKMDLGG